MADADKEEGIEYSIHVCPHPSDDAEGEPEWQQLESTDNMDQALKKAEAISYTGEYHKVEVKKKFQDPENDRTIEMTLKLYEGKAKRPATLMEIIIVAVLCGILAFLLSFFGVKFMEMQKMEKPAIEGATHADDTHKAEDKKSDKH